jgi:UPF0716 protein FxsA
LRAGGLAFVGSLLAEILAFVLVAHLIGVGWAFLALIVVSFGGLWLLRHEGPRAWRRFRDAVQSGERPGVTLSRNVIGVLGAVLIALPGFLTAIIGAALFLPPVRALAGRGAAGFATKRMTSAAAGDLFGPRLVRAKVGKTFQDTDPVPAGAGDPIEGEIV